MAIGGNNPIPSVDAASTFMLQYGQFEATHKQQLESVGLAKPLWQALYRKLTQESFDLGDYVVLYGSERNTTDASKPRGIAEHKLCLKEAKLGAESNVFLVDHAWTTSIDAAIMQLNSNPHLLERMESLTGIRYVPPKKVGLDTVTDEEIEQNVPIVAAQANVSEERARELLVSSNGNLIEAIMAAEDEASGNDKVQQALHEKIMGNMASQGDGEPETAWRTRDYSCTQYALGDDKQAIDAIDLRVDIGAGVASKDVRCEFAPKHLKVSVMGQVVVDGELYASIDAKEATWTLEGGVLTVSLVKAKAEVWPEAIAGEEHIDEREHSKHIQRVFGALWRYFQGYEFLRQAADGSLENQTNWYIQDEVGLSIQHSDTPNVACAPFLYVTPQGQMVPYSIMWPTSEIRQDEPLTRDYCPAWLKDADQRQGYLHAIFQGPTQFALDAYEKMCDGWQATAKTATRATLASQPVAAHTVSSVLVSGATPEVTQALEKQGLRLVDQASEADLVFDDVAQTSQASNHHPLNSVFFSSQSTVFAFQNVVGAQSWLRTGFLLRSQLTEFTGAALMDPHSWWVLTNDTTVPNAKAQRILTNNPTTVVRHADVGYSTALQCVPSVVSPDELHVCTRLALLTPDDGLYLWTPQMWVHKLRVQMREDKMEPYQVLPDEIEVPYSEFKQAMDGRFGAELLPELECKVDDIVADIVRIMLGFDGSDGRNFGIFSFRFSFGKGVDGVAPYLQDVKPVSISDHLSADAELLPSIISVLAGNPDQQKWKQARAA